MKFIFVFLSLLCVHQSVAQHANATWYFGTWLGINFKGNNLQVIPDKASPMYCYGSPGIISDPTSGDVILFSNGKQIWNRKHQVVENGTLSAFNGVSVNSIILPLANQQCIVVYTDASSSVYYAGVDLKANNGDGKVVFKDSLLSNQLDLQIAATPRANQQGFWLITHKKGSADFWVYGIADFFFKKTPIISTAGLPTYNETNYTYGKIQVSPTGNLLAYTYRPSATSNEAGRLSTFKIDNKCGLITLHEHLHEKVAKLQGFSSITFSASSKMLYFSHIGLSSSGSIVLQFQLDENDKYIKYHTVTTTDEYISDIQLAPDKRVYMTRSKQASFNSELSFIISPDEPDENCNFSNSVIELCRVPALGSLGAEQLPSQILALNQPTPLQKLPELTINNTCKGNITSFKLKYPEQLLFDSILWDFGDTSFSINLASTHQYKTEGKFVVTFFWYVCKETYAIQDTIIITSPPPFSLGNDTTLCFGDSLQLTGPLNASKYLWSNGENTAMIKVKKPGNYSLIADLNGCEIKSSVTINFYQPITTALGDELGICDRTNEIVKLDSGPGFNTYKWTPTGDTSQWIIVEKIGSYFVMVEDFRGCKASDGTIVNRKCPISLYFPNIFTPNNDGHNDIFQPIGSDVITIDLKIFNAWGALIFESNQQTKGWNGKINDEEAPLGVYTIVCTYTGLINNRVRIFKYEGTVTLLR
ncbi:MAG: gliding motility-associated C-terminal domain-containing protein [Bacteroidia bacterium]|jgi:gliding motility-associated-like protein|nr:gliding motility-associated C-terminal domain-containing protein [Bacteroidia bacterium]